MTENAVANIPFADAVVRAKALYLKAGAHNDDVERDAQNLLIRRLASGELRATARYFSLKVAYYVGHNSLTNAEDIPLEQDGSIPLRFWSHLLEIRMRPSGSSNWIDWVPGDFQFSWSDGLAECDAAAHGVQIRKDDLDALQLPDFDLSGSVSGQPIAPQVAKGGRPNATWWPDFAQELAIYLYENGLPDGEGRDGQSTVFDAIDSALEVRGIKIGRSTAMPVIGNVIERLRSSKN